METFEIIEKFSTDGWGIETETHVVCKGETRAIAKSPAPSGDPILGCRIFAVKKQTLEIEDYLLKKEDIIQVYGHSVEVMERYNKS
jgi:hypothetical protein